MLTPAELSLLGRLDLAYRRAAGGLYSGERRSPRSARSPEFADFRPYVSGDDFRQIDWKAFARLDRVLLRLYVAEEESCLNLVLDTSPSMELGTPPKLQAVRRLAAALAFLGLGAMDRVVVGCWQAGGPHTQRLRGRDGVGRIWSFLQGLEAGGEARPDDLPRLRWLRPGLTVLVSDFLQEEPLSAALATLRGRRQELVLWQVLAPEEERPTLSGDLKLVDAESGSGRELTITPGLVREYERALAAHRAGLARAGQAADGRFVHSSSADDLETTMLAGLRAGAVRRG
jgi:uncharacterized protein (DUF58 family)